MNIIEQATKRLEQLERAGVSVPWAAAGLAPGDTCVDGDSRHPHPVDGAPSRMPSEATPQSATRQHEAMKQSPVAAPPAALDLTDASQEPKTVMIDLEALERLGYLVPSQVRSKLAEQFRQIKRPLLRNARSKDSVEKRLSLIMVTSALPKEGKTFCAINLAMSMSIEIDTSVLLVDADVVRPDVMHRLGVESQKGLLDLLTDPQLRLSDVVLKTNVPKLSILPAGTRNSMSTELLASEAMGALLVSFAKSNTNCIVIFDAPPLLVTTEAKVLASRLGQVVMVIEASGTPRSAAMQAFAAVEQCPIVMSVMNKASEREGGSYGDYYG